MAELEHVLQKSELEVWGSQNPENKAVFEALKPGVRRNLEKLEGAPALLEDVALNLRHLRGEVQISIQETESSADNRKIISLEQRVNNRINRVLRQGIKLLRVNEYSLEQVTSIVSIAIQYGSDPEKVAEVYSKVLKHNTPRSDTTEVWWITEQIIALHRDYSDSEREILKEVKQRQGKPLTLNLVLEVFEKFDGEIQAMQDFLEKEWDKWKKEEVDSSAHTVKPSAGRRPVLTFGLKLHYALKNYQGWLSSD